MVNEYGMGLIAMIVFWGLIFTLIIWLIFTLINNRTDYHSDFRRMNAQEINEYRYKHGEINKIEYERINYLLSSNNKSTYKQLI